MGYVVEAVPSNGSCSGSLEGLLGRPLGCFVFSLTGFKTKRIIFSLNNHI